MTAVEMDQEFLILYDKLTNFDAPGYSELERSIILTKAQERVFFAHYNPLANKFREGFEESEARRKDIQELVKGVTISAPSATQTNTLPNGEFYDLPVDFLYAISEEVTLTSDDVCLNGTRVRIKPITHDEYSINVKNPFKKPDSTQVIWRLDYQGRKHELITDGKSTVSEYHLRYIKNLQPIILGSNTVNGVAGPLDSELNIILHTRIVDEAVKIATGVTDPASYQLKSIEQQEGES